MSKQFTKERKLVLKKQTVIHMKQPRKIKPCFANLWTAYFCDCYTCHPEANY